MEDLPDLRRLSKQSTIGIDTETKDPWLKEHGPGALSQRGGRLVGVSLSTKEFGDIYLPLGHGDGLKDSGNVEDPKKAIAWLKHQLAGEQTKVAHHMMYELEWLDSEGIQLGGTRRCTAVAESLIDEWRRSYELDEVGHDYLKERKNETGLREAAACYGVDPKAELWRLPAGYVGPYAEQDASLTRRIYDKQQAALDEQSLWEAYNLECDLFAPLLEMRRVGVLVDLRRAEQVREQLLKREISGQIKLNKLAGVEVDVWSGPSLATAFAKCDIRFQTTILGNPSFAAEWLESHPSQLARLVSAVRKLNKARATFIDGMIFNHVTRIDHQKGTGYIHATVRQTRDTEGGVKHGRMAMAKPNLQQVPNRDEELAPLIRSMYIAEPGAIFGKCDYSAQEPRMQDHYAIGLHVRQWEAVAKAYADDPNLDRHAWIGHRMGKPRKTAKILNLSLSYGGGIPTISAQLNCSKDQAREELASYFVACPFVKDLQDRMSARAEERGYLILMGGRRCRFPYWEPYNRKWDEYVKPLPRDQAEKMWAGTRLKRAMAHKALNRMIQGSCSYQTKRAMIMAHAESITPALPVHDELSGSRSSEAECHKLAKIMEEAVQLKVPTVVDVKIGKNWGECT